MMIYYPLLREPVVFEENIINILIIENPRAFRDLVCMLTIQTEGESSDLVLSDHFEPIEISKYAEIITDVFRIDFDSKKLLTKLNQMLTKNCLEEYEWGNNIISQLNQFGTQLSMTSDLNITFNELTDISAVIKLLGFCIDQDEMELPEKILEYMRLCRRFLNKKLFVFVNLKSCLTQQELTLLYKSILYEKFDVWLIESFQMSMPLDCERTKIIDVDLCEI